jgi:cytochrome b involved in lipid metabolism
MHPGGKSTITNVCGKDASTVFANRGGTGKHSNSAWNLLGTFLVGSLPGAVVPVKSALSGYSEVQVASHASASDCWVIVNDNVYSVTSYLSMHPGGKSIILNLCGKDTTSDFTTRGGTGAHTSYAWSVLGGYIVGSLSIAIPSVPVVAPSASATTATTAATKEYTASDVSRHNSPADCWITINNTIYSVAGYMNAHPGGTSVIKAVCGKDATIVFTSRGGTGAHSVSAWNMLGMYSVGINNT